ALSRSLGDVRGDRESRPARLRRQAVELASRKAVCGVVHFESQLIRYFPSSEALVRGHGSRIRRSALPARLNNFRVGSKNGGKVRILPPCRRAALVLPPCRPSLAALPPFYFLPSPTGSLSVNTLPPPGRGA